MHRLSRLASRERHVIGLLRGADLAFVDNDLRDLFGQLRTAAAAIGFRSAPRGCAYVTREELCLLGVIAGMQRVNPDLTVRVTKAMRAPAFGCARRLAETGVQLSSATFARLSGMAVTCDELSISVTPIIKPPKRSRPVHPPMPGSLQAKALSFIRTRGPTSSRDLAAVGVSRQVVSLMFKRGVLERVRMGVYRAAETVRG